MRHPLCAAMKYLLVNSDWAKLNDECAGFVDAHYASSTRRTRSVQVEAYLEFCRIFQDRLSPYPCPPSQVCLYMSFLARRMCYSSMRQYVSALNNHLKDVGAPAIDYKNHRTKKCLAGIRRSLGDVRRQAPPLLPAHLLRMFRGLSGSRGHVAVRAAMLLSFRALLRKCHVTESEATLSRGDFTFFEWGMMVRVRKSKTIQYQERVHLIPVSRVLDNRLCAVHWVQRHFESIPAPPRAPAFQVPRAGGSASMPYPFYLGCVKLLSTGAGILPNVTTHSLRRGGATYLRMCGATLAEIKERGDWRSDAVFEYLKYSVEERLALDLRVAALLANYV